MEYIIAAVIGYFFGCVNMAYIIAKSKGINIKKVGSNNAGASNVFISVGKIQGIAVGAFDILKSFCAAELIFIIFRGNFEAAVIAGVFAVIGHNFPFWMNFNGGKGLAPFMGAILFYNWKLFILFAIIIIAATLITDYISIGTFAVSLLMPIYVFFFAERHIIFPLFAVLTIIIWLKHTDNMKRLINGTEIGFRKKNKTKKEP